MSRFNFSSFPLAGLIRIERQSIGDSRGSFERMFCSDEMQSIGWHKKIAQVNHTHTKSKGVIRGLHFQNPPHAEMKIVSCIRGEVWDVTVDLRANSATFLHWHAEVLSGKNGYSLLIPEGFAHGFQTLTDEVEMLYFHSEKYEPKSEAGLNPEDPMLNIVWPIVITELSLRDRSHPLLNSQFRGIAL